MVVTPELGEAAANDLYREHVSDCLGCDPGAGRLCALGMKLHRRWRRVQAAETGT